MARGTETGSSSTPWVQALVSMGYAVVQPQFRGSVGFGLHHLNAATGQWSGKMFDDVVDATNWAVRSGLADPKRIGIFGGSYGGYAAMCGLTLHPSLYRCGIELSGPIDVGALLHSMMNTWAPVRIRWVRRIGGDASTNEALNRRISPYYHVDKIRVPVLIMHGAHDPRVKQSQAENMVAALRAHHVPVEYVLYPDEGHGIGQTKNLVDFFSRAERFLDLNMK